MTAGNGVDPVLSMSLFKSPDCAQQVWQWLDKHGDTPVQRERFKHLVNICTVKPVKVPSTQALQRTTACQGSGSSTTKLSARQQSLATQGSTRFIPEASISHKPAALARPASAAAARRRHEVSQRPATAAATIGSARTSSIPPSIQRSLLSKMQPPALPKPNMRQILQQTEAVGTAVCAQLNTQAAAALQPNVAPASAPAGPLEPASTDAASPTSAQTTQASKSGSIAAPVRQANAQSSSANTAADSATPSSSSALHASPNSAALQPPQAAEPVSRPSTRSSSRCSTRSGKGTKTGCSPFDTRLALLHKGLPTHLPYAAIARPFSRSRRPSSSLQHASAASGDSNAILSGKEGAVDPAPDVLNLERAADSSEGNRVEAPSAAQAAAKLQSELNVGQPQSPTSVLPGTSLLDTTYHSFYSLADAYPELYQQAAIAGRAHKANERALVSVLADTLKGDSSLWKKQLCSTYTACNDKLAHDMGWDTLEGLGDQAFLKWVARSQLYSGDLLEPAALQDLTLWMEAAPASERREMMALLRDLHASVNPTGPHLKSVSHSVHTKQVPFSNAMEQLEKSMATSNASSSASASTNGSAPATSPGVVVGSPALTGGPALASSPATGLVSSFTSVTVPTQSLSQAQTNVVRQGEGAGVPQRGSAPSSQAPAVPQIKRARGVNVNAVACPDTFKSSINLSQGAPPAFRSTYTDLHASSMPQLMQAVQTVARQRAQAQKPVLVTAPFGKLDPLMDHAHLTVFPIPSGLLQPAAEPHTVSDRSGLDTTHYGQSYCSNLYKGDAAAVLAATQRDVAASKVAGTRVTIPLGKKAVNCIPVYNTTYHDEYQPRPFDVARQHASAEHVRSMFHAPTATVGCMTG